jgi:acyl dehydratase
MIEIEGYDDIKGRVGEHFGYSPWVEISQEQVNRFADSTDDHQWIHVDVERAKDGPFGGTIAHGYLTLSLTPALLNKVVRVTGYKLGVNYGLEKARFPAPVPVGAKVRMGVELAACDEVAGGYQLVWKVTHEVEGGAKPACVAEVIYRYFTA